MPKKLADQQLDCLADCISFLIERVRARRGQDQDIIVTNGSSGALSSSVRETAQTAQRVVSKNPTGRGNDTNL